MVFESWNPFYGIIETKKFPYARTLRTSFWQKMQDVFHIIVGDADHPGLMDYATFFLRLWIDSLFEYADEGEKKNNFFLGIFYFSPILLITASAGLAYYIFACAIAVAVMLVASPIVGLVHLVSDYFRKDYNIDTALMVIRGEDSGRKETTSLHEFLNTYDLTIEDIQLSGVKKRKQTDMCYSFVFSIKSDTENEDTESEDTQSEDTQSEDMESEETVRRYTFETTLPQNDIEALNDKTKWFTFFRLNIANITAGCEEYEEKHPTNHIIDTFSVVASSHK